MTSPLSHLRISPFNTSIMFGFNRLWGSLVSLDPSSIKIRCSHMLGGTPFISSNDQTFAALYSFNILVRSSSWLLVKEEEIMTGNVFLEPKKMYFRVDGSVLSSTSNGSLASRDSFTRSTPQISRISSLKSNSSSNKSKAPHDYY